MGFGRNGERVAKTPMRLLPPSLGGRTVGDHSSRTASENCQMSQRWEYPSMPRKASGFRYSGSKTIFDVMVSTSPLWRGMPNLAVKSFRMWAMTEREWVMETSEESGMIYSLREYDIRLTPYDIPRVARYDIISVPTYAEGIYHPRSGISYRRYITRSERNGYHCKKSICQKTNALFAWRTGQDSNPRPTESESVALSS